jgi:hypothetical protein
MAEVIYLLCAATSILCAVLLLRGYRRSRTRLLLWSSLCFLGLAFNNVVLFIDLVIVPSVDLWTLRAATSVASMTILVFGLVWEDR